MELINRSVSSVALSPRRPSSPLLRFRRLAGGMFGLAVILTVAPANAQAPLVVGTGGGGNVFPFSNSYTGTYQQIYASSAFSTPVVISQIAFASNGTTGSQSYTDTLRLGTTSATPAAPGNNYATNRRADLTTVFSGTVTPTLLGNGTFDLIFNLTTPFVYNPAVGNLLLEVVNTPNSPGAFDFGFSADFGRVYNSAGTGSPTAGPNEGLRTRFSFASVAGPEPASLALLALGAVAGGVIARRRSR